MLHNKSMFSTGRVPKLFKQSITILIYKSGDKKMTNYRSISIKSNFAKVFEEALKNRLQPFIEKHKILSKWQFGIRNNMSTENAAVHELAYKIEYSLN